VKYKNDPSSETLAEINKTLVFIREHTIGLVEKAGDTKWTQGQTVFSYSDNELHTYVYMIGALKSGKVTWHIMPYYAIEVLRNKWSQDLVPFISGKSCINFDKFDDLPIEALTNIVVDGTRQFKCVLSDFEQKKKVKHNKKKRSPG